ncbi:MAG: DoxX family protein [Sulfurospirillaceae bacterium]|jgi:putative oxidoreductase|nr:DoxX family protein [Sulfurospirillaceae bacterium]MDD2825328.1 DoxX family protein [Sulfurospirillaceae bacterium]
MGKIESLLSKFHSTDIAVLLLRLAVGCLMLFHGFYKLQQGIGGIERLVSNAHLPQFLAYGVFIGELIIPVFLILGLWTRASALVLALTMMSAIYLAFGSKLLALNTQGGLAIELPLLFLVGSLVLIFTGGGKWSVIR